MKGIQAMTTHRSFVLSAVGALTVFGMLALADQAVADQLSGQINSVDPVAKKVVVKETESGTDVTVVINDLTPITTTSGSPYFFKNLKTGDGVGITHNAGVASRVVVNPKPPELSGQITSVDVDAKRLVVTPIKTDKEVPVAINDRTTIITSTGEKRELKNLKPGDGVGITYAGNFAWQIIVNVKPDELTGHVKSVAADLKSFVLTETGTNIDITVVVNKDTRLVTSEGKKIELKDLKKGDGVGVAHRASLASEVVVNVKPLQ